jgi:hypothetical protein
LRILVVLAGRGFDLLEQFPCIGSPQICGVIVCGRGANLHPFYIPATARLPLAAALLRK